MEEKTEKKVSVEQLQKELYAAQERYAELYKQSQQQINSLNYQNAFNQQHFMIELLKLHDVIGDEMTAKVIDSINSFWFSKDEDESK